MHVFVIMNITYYIFKQHRKVVLLLVFFSISYIINAQNDTLKNKGKKSFKSFLDTQKKADGITIALPEKINPLFNISRAQAPVLKSIEYYLNLNNNSTQKSSRNFMSKAQLDDDVLVKRSFNGQDTSNPILKSHVDLGEIESSTAFIRLDFRDFGLVDGDRIRIFLNGIVVKENIILFGMPDFIELKMKRGYNRIDFSALSNGRVSPNTAEFHVFDDKGKLIKVGQWGILKSQNATLGIINY